MDQPTSRSNAPLDPNGRPEREPWIADWHISRFFKRLLPRPVVNGLRQIKGRVLTRDFPRHTEFKQSPEDGQASAFMSIVVPIHDAPAVTRRCLASLEKYAPESEIILVDDASARTETLEVIRYFSSRGGWKVVHHEKALGHSEACRAGANLAARPYLCFLNSDTVVTPWCWRRVKEVFEHNQEIGVVGPSTSHSGNPQLLPVAFGLSPYWNDNQICAFAERLLNECQEPILLDLPWVSGFAFFIRRDLWEQVGGFDQRLPDYGNDFEVCSRVAAKGYRIVWIRDCYIHHFGNQSYLESIGEEGILERVRAAEIHTGPTNRSLAP
jgi:GT2 family glycosyltransferase